MVHEGPAGLVPTESYAAIGAGMTPVLIFIAVRSCSSSCLRVHGLWRRTYAIGSTSRRRAFPASMSSGTSSWSMSSPACWPAGGVVLSARGLTAQWAWGHVRTGRHRTGVIGGTSLAGGAAPSWHHARHADLRRHHLGFTFLRIDAYYQEMLKGGIIVGAVVLDVYRQRYRGRS